MSHVFSNASKLRKNFFRLVRLARKKNFNLRFLIYWFQLRFLARLVRARISDLWWFDSIEISFGLRTRNSHNRQLNARVWRRVYFPFVVQTNARSCLKCPYTCRDDINPNKTEQKLRTFVTLFIMFITSETLNSHCTLKLCRSAFRSKDGIARQQIEYIFK